MTTPGIPFATRRAVNPMLTDETLFDDEAHHVNAFLTPAGRMVHRWIPLVSSLIAGVFLLAGFLTDKLGGPPQVVALSVMTAFVLAGIPGLQSAWESIREWSIDIDVLMVLGAVLAAIIGEPMEGALLLFLFALSGALEHEATRRTQTALNALRELHPAEALVLDDEGHSTRMASKFVPVAARILVRPGDRVALDGRVVEGTSAVDEAPITGESMPRKKTTGDDVYAGTINGSGRLVVEVTRPASESQLARIIALVTEARQKKASTERLFDRLSPKYATAVIGMSLLVAVVPPVAGWLSWKDAIYRAIALLIVASPCALIIATPTAYLSAIACAARRGVLIKGGVYLEILARCRKMIFDKTGTLTEGRPRVAGVLTSNGLTEDELLRVAGALEASTSHPLASAVDEMLSRRGLSAYAAEDVEIVAGRGIRGRVNRREALLGSTEWIRESLPENRHAALEAMLNDGSSDGRTLSVLSFGDHVGTMSFEDPLREDAVDTIRRLRGSGIDRMVMLTGDRDVTARRVAERLGLDAYHANLMPEEKITQAEAQSRAGGPIAVIGDGVNDAPVLARADAGIAMASIGSDAALEAAPIVLMSNSLERLAWLNEHARKTLGIVRQNITLALSVIVIMSVLAVSGRADLPLAVIAHEGSTLLVALNALRLLRG